MKFHQYLYGYQEKISKPLFKFLGDFLFGLIRQKEINHSGISRQLRERISVKKTEERLRYHLSKEELYEELLTAYLERNKREIFHQKYLIYDDSDIQKPYAVKMEGLQYVRDGSRSTKESVKTGLGYHWSNIIGVTQEGHIFPLYSEIYSVSKDKDLERSENSKIIHAFDRLREYASSDAVIVIDRGGDRRVLMEHFIHQPYYFIIRQQGNRHVNYKGKARKVSEISRQIELKHEWRVKRKNRGKEITRTYAVGAICVGFKVNKSDEMVSCWLVKTKEKGVKKGYSYFLCYLPAETEEEAIEMCMEGYSYRWKVEEFHRQIKQDYSLEKIRYQSYTRIHNIGALLLIALGFMAKFQDEKLDFLLHFTRLTVPKHKSISYYFYRITEGLKLIFATIERVWRLPREPIWQPELPLL